ncbi:DNA-3-methyladenine glycosylase [candidate division KSB1 bacterium]|nr:DNA-3-methyladenine glycosylase [candidate division KSB1 bacterium]
MHRQIAATGEDLNFALTLRRYQAYGEDAANYFDGKDFRKVFAASDKHFLLSLREANGGVILGVQPPTRSQAVWQAAGHVARKILGLDFPLAAFYQFAKSDSILRELTQKFRGFRPTLSTTPFESIVTSITAQQINLQFAFTVRSRLVRRYGEKLIVNGQTYFAFPQPKKLARAKVSSLRQLQFTGKKSEYTIGLARAIRDGQLDLETLSQQPEENIAEKLMALHGIGRWTVDWFLARCLGRGHAFPAGDLGVRKAVQHFYFNGEPKPEAELREFAKRWGEFANLATHYLLTGLALGM